MSAALQKRLDALKLEVVKCRTSPLMALHWSPYVNVAFQREEIGRRRGTPSGCWIPSSNVHTYFNFSLVIEA